MGLSKVLFVLMQEFYMKKLIIGLFLCVASGSFCVLDDIVGGIEGGVKHVLSSTDKALHTVVGYKHVSVPMPFFDLSNEGVAVMFDDVQLDSSNGLIYNLNVVNNNKLEMIHPDFVAIFLFDPQNNMLSVRVGVGIDQQEKGESYYARESYSTLKSAAVTLAKPIDNVSVAHVTNNLAKKQIAVFFPYKR